MDDGSSAGEEEEAASPLKPSVTLRRDTTSGSSTLGVPVKSSPGFVGTMRGLFGHRGGSELGSGSGSGGRRWSKVKKRHGRGHGDDDADMSEEPDVGSEPAMLTVKAPRSRVVSDRQVAPPSGGYRLRRARKVEELVGAERGRGGEGVSERRFPRSNILLKSLALPILLLIAVLPDLLLSLTSLASLLTQGLLKPSGAHQHPTLIILRMGGAIRP
ncbi:hypothetical protein C8R47DRAFT_1222291 [Mycena vitilis]|nr:hypothetical protein C8R47DRAFT_1222291 [Mycena vitilis]